MANEMDAPGLFANLESNRSEKANEVKNIIHETLSKNPKDTWLVHGLVEYYINTNSLRCFEILTELREPHDKHLFDKLADSIKNSTTRISGLMLFGHIICRQPSWLYRVANHSLLSILLKLLKTDNEVVVLLIGLLNLINLLPIIPAMVSSNLNIIFEIFSRLAAWNTTKAANIPETSILHFQVGVYSLFHRLYGMYPCNFLAYLRSHYGNRENLEIFAKTIRPMLDRVRMHPLLVTASKDSELSTNRWRQMETHAVVMECAKVSLDIIEGISNELVAYQYTLDSEAAAESASSTMSGTCSYISSERQGLLKTKKTDTASVWSSYKDDSASDTFEVKELNSVTSSYLTSPRASATKVELVTSFGESQPSSPLRMIGSPIKFAGLTDDFIGKKDLQKHTAARALLFLESSTEEKTSSGKFFHTKSNDSDSDVDREVSELIGRIKPTTSILEDSGKEEERNLRLSQRSDSVIHDEAEGIQSDDYEDCTDPSFNVAELVCKASRMRYFSQCGQPPEISELRPKIKIHRSQSCPDVSKSLKQTQNEGSKVKRCIKSRNFSQQQSSVGKDGEKTVEGQVSVVVEKPEAVATLPQNELILQALPMMAPTCCLRCKFCLDHGAVVKEMSPAEILDRHISHGNEVHTKEINVAANRNLSPQTVDETSTARSQLLLLYNQLLFERHRRGLHAERNRCLLAKLKKAQATDDQQAVSTEQAKRKENEHQDLKQQFHGLISAKLIELVEKMQTVDALTTENRSVKTEIENIKSENEKLKKMLNSVEHQSEERLKELQSCQAKLNAVTMELHDSKMKLAENNKVHIELERVRNEHVLLGELQQKYREKLSSISNQSSRKLETSHLIQSYKTDLITVKHQLEQRTQQNEFLKARLAELESQLSVKELIINEQKNSFHKVKEENEEKVKILEERNSETLHNVSSLVSYIRQLTSHHSFDNSELLRQMPNVIQSSSIQSFRSYLAASSTTEVLSSSRRSSGGSDNLDLDSTDCVKKH